MAASTGEDFRPDRSGAREPVRGRTPRHEIRALLRAHLAAASGYRHLTRHCAVCARILRLALDPATASGARERTAADPAAPSAPERARAPEEASSRAQEPSKAGLRAPVARTAPLPAPAFHAAVRAPAPPGRPEEAPDTGPRASRTEDESPADA
ncbi:DUF6274 family protein [Streptomyces sp. RTGN2]|uniref:DUF6274 family protein n=1 Tax=Streptomyces sp. RTGN2 TaxID=3016525 RepID=UPI002552AB9E|nr:DUF6274 family protein [Streptomyces sp. RTGN2]